MICFNILYSPISLLIKKLSKLNFKTSFLETLFSIPFCMFSIALSFSNQDLPESYKLSSFASLRVSNFSETPKDSTYLVT